MVQYRYWVSEISHFIRILQSGTYRWETVLTESDKIWYNSHEKSLGPLCQRHISNNFSHFKYGNLCQTKTLFSSDTLFTFGNETTCSCNNNCNKNVILLQAYEIPSKYSQLILKANIKAKIKNWTLILRLKATAIFRHLSEVNIFPRRKSQRR